MLTNGSNNNTASISSTAQTSPTVSPFTVTHEESTSPVTSSISHQAFPIANQIAPPHHHASGVPLANSIATSPTDTKSTRINSEPLPAIKAAPAPAGPLPSVYPIKNSAAPVSQQPNGVILPSLQMPQQQVQLQQQLPIQHHQIQQPQQPQVTYVHPHKPHESLPVNLRMPESYPYVTYDRTSLQRQSCPPNVNVASSQSQTSPPAQSWVAVPISTYGNQYVEPQYYHQGSTPSYVYHPAQYIYNQQSAIGQPRKQTKQTTWTPEEDKLLRHLKGVQKLGWREISAFFYDRTPNACQFRWRRIISGIANTKSHGPKSIASRGLSQISKKSHHSINFLLN